MPFKFTNNPKLAALASTVETAVVLAFATFALNLASALNTASQGHPFDFNWQLQAYMLAAAGIGSVGKGILAYFGAVSANAPATKGS
jgi:hypothetical protein